MKLVCPILFSLFPITCPSSFGAGSRLASSHLVSQRGSSPVGTRGGAVTPDWGTTLQRSGLGEPQEFPIALGWG